MTTHRADLRPGRQDDARVLALGSVLVVVALKCALTVAVAGRYGWHRDELYYAVAGLHLQGGYVEFPPVTALLAALARLLFGWSLVGCARSRSSPPPERCWSESSSRASSEPRGARRCSLQLSSRSAPGCSRPTGSSSRSRSTS